MSRFLEVFFHRAVQDHAKCSETRAFLQSNDHVSEHLRIEWCVHYDRCRFAEVCCQSITRTDFYRRQFIVFHQSSALFSKPR